MPADRPLPSWAQRLIELRRAQAWSPADLACQLKKLREGLPSVRSLAHMIQLDWETGKHRPGPRYRLLLAAVYGADEHQLFGDPATSKVLSQPARRPDGVLAGVAVVTGHGPYAARTGLDSGAVFTAAAHLCEHEESADGRHLGAEAEDGKLPGALTLVPHQATFARVTIWRSRSS